MPQLRKGALQKGGGDLNAKLCLVGAEAEASFLVQGLSHRFHLPNRGASNGL
jgi:hypothetical protein